MMRIVMLLTFMMATIATDRNNHSTRLLPKYLLTKKTINNLRECRRHFNWICGIQNFIRRYEKKLEVKTIPFVSTPIVCNQDTYNFTMRTIVEDALLLFTFM